MPSQNLQEVCSNISLSQYPYNYKESSVMDLVTNFQKLSFAILSISHNAPKDYTPINQILQQTSLEKTLGQRCGDYCQLDSREQDVADEKRQNSQKTFKTKRNASRVKHKTDGNRRRKCEEDAHTFNNRSAFSRKVESLSAKRQKDEFIRRLKMSHKNWNSSTSLNLDLSCSERKAALASFANHFDDYDVFDYQKRRYSYDNMTYNTPYDDTSINVYDHLPSSDKEKRLSLPTFVLETDLRENFVAEFRKEVGAKAPPVENIAQNDSFPRQESESCPNTWEESGTKQAILDETEIWEEIPKFGYELVVDIVPSLLDYYTNKTTKFIDENTPIEKQNQLNVSEDNLNYELESYKNISNILDAKKESTSSENDQETQRAKRDSGCVLDDDVFSTAFDLDTTLASTESAILFNKELRSASTDKSSYLSLSKDTLDPFMETKNSNQNCQEEINSSVSYNFKPTKGFQELMDYYSLPTLPKIREPKQETDELVRAIRSIIGKI